MFCAQYSLALNILHCSCLIVLCLPGSLSYTRCQSQTVRLRSTAMTVSPIRHICTWTHIRFGQSCSLHFFVSQFSFRQFAILLTWRSSLTPARMAGRLCTYALTVTPSSVSALSIFASLPSKPLATTIERNNRVDT